MSKQHTILITGCGGPAAISFYKAIAQDGHQFYMGDIDPCASGFFVTEPGHRVLLKPGNDQDFVTHLLHICKKLHVDTLVPTVDSELMPIAQHISKFQESGIKVLLANKHTLEFCMDKSVLLQKTKALFPHQLFFTYDHNTNLSEIKYPIIIKPKHGSGARGIALLQSEKQLASIPKDGSYYFQTHLPGTEYSVDTYRNQNGVTIATVPRVRMKIDSGIVVTGKTVHNPKIENLAKSIADSIDLFGVANIQFKEDANGEPVLLEVNPRFPGSMPITVKAGVNMPKIFLEEVCDGTILSDSIQHLEIGMSRIYHEMFFNPQEIEEIT